MSLEGGIDSSEVGKGLASPSFSTQLPFIVERSTVWFARSNMSVTLASILSERVPWSLSPPELFIVMFASITRPSRVAEVKLLPPIRTMDQPWP